MVLAWFYHYQLPTGYQIPLQQDTDKTQTPGPGSEMWIHKMHWTDLSSNIIKLDCKETSSFSIFRQSPPLSCGFGPSLGIFVMVVELLLDAAGVVRSDSEETSLSPGQRRHRHGEVLASNGKHFYSNSFDVWSLFWYLSIAKSSKPCSQSPACPTAFVAKNTAAAIPLPRLSSLLLSLPVPTDQSNVSNQMSHSARTQNGWNTPLKLMRALEELQCGK